MNSSTITRPLTLPAETIAEQLLELAADRDSIDEAAEGRALADLLPFLGEIDRSNYLDTIVADLAEADRYAMMDAGDIRYLHPEVRDAYQYAAERADEFRDSARTVALEAARSNLAGLAA